MTPWNTFGYWRDCLLKYWSTIKRCTILKHLNCQSVFLRQGTSSSMNNSWPRKNRKLKSNSNLEINSNRRSPRNKESQHTDSPQQQHRWVRGPLREPQERFVWNVKPSKQEILTTGTKLGTSNSKFTTPNKHLMLQECLWFTLASH